MFFIKFGILFIICLICLQMTGSILGITPQIQTSVFKGEPANWAPNLDSNLFTKIGYKHYYINNITLVNWYQAVHECRSLNARLLTIENAGELAALDKYLANANLYEWFWTSGNDLGKEGSYYWLETGKPISFKFWAPSEPNNLDNEENCIRIERLNGGGNKMHDAKCDWAFHYICEAKGPQQVAITFW